MGTLIWTRGWRPDQLIGGSGATEDLNAVALGADTSQTWLCPAPYMIEFWG